MCGCSGNKMSHCSGCGGTCGMKGDMLHKKQFVGNDNGYNLDLYNTIVGLNGNGNRGVAYGQPDRVTITGNPRFMSHWEDGNDTEMVVDPETQKQVDDLPDKPSTYDKVKGWFDDGTADKAAATGMSVLSWLKTGKAPATRTPTAGGSADGSDTGSDHTLYWIAGGVMLLILGVGLYFAFRKK